jgi:hypothetical protein
MGIVLSFTPRSAAIKRPSSKTAAAVVIFPGVRYERAEVIGHACAPGTAASQVPLTKPDPRH